MSELNKIFGIVALTSIISGTVAGGLSSYYVTNNQGFTQEQSTVNFTNKLEDEESAMIEAIEKVSPAVVSVIVTRELQQFYNNPFFFFNGIPSNQAEPQSEKRQIGGGTGFIVTKDGLLLTNRHVVNDEKAEFTVLLNDGTTFYASIVSRDPTNDLAVMQIYTDEDRTKKPSDLPTLSLGDSDNLKIGSKVIAIGNALSEFSNTTTSGIISGKGRNIIAGGGRERVTALNNLLQTDAAINPGNSGGPLVNLAGEVIGINTAIAEEANGIGFAIPINDVKSAIESVQENGKIIRPYLGVRYTELNSKIAEELGLPVEFGAYLLDDLETRTPAVLPGSPAEKAGLRSGDIVTGVNDQKIDLQNSLQRLISQYKVGETVEILVQRGRDEIKVLLELEEFAEKTD